MKWLATRRMKSALGPPTTERLDKSSPSGRMVKLIERDQQKQQEHIHSPFIMVEIFFILRSRFVQSELSPQLRQTQRQMTNASDAPLTDTGTVIAERRQTLVTKRSVFPVLFKDANTEIFKVQSIDNIESFYEYESGKTNIYVKGRLDNSLSFWENIGTSDFILSVIEDGYIIPLLNCPPKICLSNNKSSFGNSTYLSLLKSLFWIY